MDAPASVTWLRSLCICRSLAINPSLEQTRRLSWNESARKFKARTSKAKSQLAVLSFCIMVSSIAFGVGRGGNDNHQVKDRKSLQGAQLLTKGKPHSRHPRLPQQHCFLPAAFSSVGKEVSGTIFNEENTKEIRDAKLFGWMLCRSSQSFDYDWGGKRNHHETTIALNVDSPSWKLLNHRLENRRPISNIVVADEER